MKASTSLGGKTPGLALIVLLPLVPRPTGLLAAANPRHSDQHCAYVEVQRLAEEAPAASERPRPHGRRRSRAEAARRRRRSAGSTRSPRARTQTSSRAAARAGTEASDPRPAADPTASEAADRAAEPAASPAADGVASPAPDPAAEPGASLAAASDPAAGERSDEAVGPDAGVDVEAYVAAATARVRGMVASAREERDILRADCLADKLARLEGLRFSSEKRARGGVPASDGAAAPEAARGTTEVDVLVDEAEACRGEDELAEDLDAEGGSDGDGSSDGGGGGGGGGGSLGGATGGPAGPAVPPTASGF